jgi:hypothetical protein
MQSLHREPPCLRYRLLQRSKGLLSPYGPFYTIVGSEPKHFGGIKVDEGASLHLVPLLLSLRDSVHAGVQEAVYTVGQAALLITAQLAQHTRRDAPVNRVSSGHPKTIRYYSLVPAHSGKLLNTLLVLSLQTNKHVSPRHLIRARTRSYLGDLIRDEFG